MKFMNQKKKKIQSKHEIDDILNAPLNFYISWGTIVVTLIMIILMIICSNLSCIQTIKGEACFRLINEYSIECSILIEKQYLNQIQKGQEIIIGNEVEGKTFIGYTDSILLQLDDKNFIIKPFFPFGLNDCINKDIIDSNISRKDARIIVGNFSLGEKILESFIKLFAKDNRSEMN